MTETLTDEERNMLDDISPTFGGKALRIIDAHAADRAALVAQHEADLQATHREYDRSTAALVAQVDGLNTALDTAEKRHVELVAKLLAQGAQVAELTRERDEALEGDGYWHAAAVEEGKAKLRAEGELRAQERATQQVSAEVIRLTKELAAAEQQNVALTNETWALGSRAEAAEARLRELTDRVSQALTGLRPGSPVGEALEEALRAP